MTRNRMAGNEHPRFFYPGRSAKFTHAFSRFLADYHENVDSFLFLVSLTARADRTRVTAAKALIDGAKPEEVESLKKSANDPDAALRQLMRFASVQSRNLTNATVNGLQHYFSEIIQAAASKRSEILRSSETLRVDEILRFKRNKDLVTFLIDKKINELSYGGIKGMESYFRDRLGIEMFATDRSRILLTTFVEIRNINVHNRGFVNDLFLSKVGKVDGLDFIKGKYFHVDMDMLKLMSDNAIETALKLDHAVAAKFGLQRKSHERWVTPNVKGKKK
jgi:hypothetical protein